MTETEGLLSKNSLEGVLTISGRRIWNRWMRLDEGKREGLGRRSWGRCGGTAIAGDQELAGVARPSSTGHGSMNGWYREKAEVKTITIMRLARPRKARCGTRHGWQWRELTGSRGDSPRGYD
jgi:hypothetical protein